MKNYVLINYSSNLISEPILCVRQINHNNKRDYIIRVCGKDSFTFKDLSSVCQDILRRNILCSSQLFKELRIFVNFLHWLVVPLFILYSVYVYARADKLKFSSFEFQTLSRRKIVMFLAAISLRIVITSIIFQHNTRYLAKGAVLCIFPYNINFKNLNLIYTWPDKALNGTLVNRKCILWRVTWNYAYSLCVL